RIAARTLQPALQVADRARAQVGAGGKLLLRQPSRRTIAPQQRPEGRSASGFTLCAHSDSSPHERLLKRPVPTHGAPPKGVGQRVGLVRGAPPPHRTHYEQNNRAVVRLMAQPRKEMIAMSYQLDQVPQYPDLAGKVAVVTGGSRGIGAVTCRILAANDVRVAVNGRDHSAIETVVARIRSEGGNALGVEADCTDFAAVEHMRQRVEQELGP